MSSRAKHKARSHRSERVKANGRKRPCYVRSIERAEKIEQCQSSESDTVNQSKWRWLCRLKDTLIRAIRSLYAAVNTTVKE